MLNLYQFEDWRIPETKKKNIINKLYQFELSKETEDFYFTTDGFQLWRYISHDYSRCYIRPVACILQSIQCESIYSRHFDEIAIKKFLRNDLIHELIIVSLSCQIVEYSNPYENFALKFHSTRPCLEKSILKWVRRTVSNASHNVSVTSY